MNIQDFIDDIFFAKGEFAIQNRNGGTKGVGISNNTLEWCKTKGLDIHYELQKDNKGQMYIRLDCHIFPYWETRRNNNEDYQNAVYEYYAKERADNIFKMRKEIWTSIKSAYRKFDETFIILPKKFALRYIWLLKRFIPGDCTKEQLQAEVWGFIAQTYPTLIQTLRGMGIISEEK